MLKLRFHNEDTTFKSIYVPSNLITYIKQFDRVSGQKISDDIFLKNQHCNKVEPM